MAGTLWFLRLAMLYLLVACMLVFSTWTAILFIKISNTDLKSCLHGIDRRWHLIENARRNENRTMSVSLVNDKSNKTGVNYAEEMQTAILATDEPGFSDIYSTLGIGEQLAVSNGRNLSRTPKFPVRVAVVNTVKFHFEVVFWLVDTLKRLDEVNLSVVLAEHRHGSREFLKTILPLGPEPMDFVDWKSIYESNAIHSDTPDFIFLSTCLGGDLVNMTRALQRMRELNPWLKLVCIVHHPSRVLENHEKLLSFAEEKSLTLITLSPHVCKRFRNDIFPQLVNISLAFNSLQFSSMPATFLLPQSSPCPQWEAGALRNWLDKKFIACFANFVIQGKFDMNRRNYSEVFDGLNMKFSKDESIKSWAQFQLNLLGAYIGQKVAQPPYPIVSHVFQWEGLMYDEFYYLMHHNVALIPAFARDEYYTEISSSSVAASLIAGVPVIASKRFLEAYSFFDESAVFLQDEGETEADVVDRILTLPGNEISEKRLRLARLNRRLVEMNILRFKWILRSKIGRC